MANRRTFLRTMMAGAVGAGAVSPSPGVGAAGARVAPSDRVRVGMIGAGLIGTRHLIDFAAQPDVDVVAIAELSPARMQAARARTEGRAEAVTDFRRMLDRKDIDAIVVSTPDHWHALMTVMACAAGKDVYVEKPLTHVVREGDWMLSAATRHQRIVQVGTQQRSGRHYQRAKALLREGHLGDIRHVHVRSTRNIVPGFTRPVDDPQLIARSLGHVARAGACGPVRSKAGALPLPLVLGLLGRADDQPARARSRHRAVDDRRHADARLGVRAAALAAGLRRDSGCVRGHLRVPRLPPDVVQLRGLGRTMARARDRWHEGDAHDLARRIRDHP